MIVTYETRCGLLIGSDIVLVSVECIVFERERLLLRGTSSKNEMSCMTCPAGLSRECLDVNRGETVTARVLDFSIAIGRKAPPISGRLSNWQVSILVREDSIPIDGKKAKGRGEHEIRWPWMRCSGDSTFRRWRSR